MELFLNCLMGGIGLAFILTLLIYVYSSNRAQRKQQASEQRYRLKQRLCAIIAEDRKALADPRLPVKPTLSPVSDLLYELTSAAIGTVIGAFFYR